MERHGGAAGVRPASVRSDGFAPDRPADSEPARPLARTSAAEPVRHDVDAEPPPPAGPRLTRDPPPAAPLRLPHPDWLFHRLVIGGPAAALENFRVAAAGAGVIPWQLDLDRSEEDLFHRLVSPPAPQQRSLSVAGARILTAQLRNAVARRHEQAVSRVGHSRACPFDLQALVPVPASVLRRGPDDPAADAWLWEHWGTTQALRHVTAAAVPARDAQLAPDAAARGVVEIKFWAADWSPWRALSAIAARWPMLRFDLRPSYDGP